MNKALNNILQGVSTGASFGVPGAIIGGLGGAALSFIGQESDTNKSIIPNSASRNGKYEKGGVANINQIVELEGEELIETPSGEQKVIKGDKHSKGGIPMELVGANEALTETQLPEGSKIYSNKTRVIDQETGKEVGMRDRKERRVKSLNDLFSKTNKVKDKLDNAKIDKFQRNTLKRNQQNLESLTALNKKEDHADVQYMDLVNEVNNYKKNGGKAEYAFGGTPGIYKHKFPDQFPNMMYKYDGKNWHLSQDGGKTYSQTNGDDYITGDKVGEVVTISDPIRIPDEESQVQSIGTSNQQVQTNTSPLDALIADSGKYLPSNTNSNPVGNSGDEANSLLSSGDKLGMLGLGVSSLAPTALTVIDRLTDKGNVNEYADFGKDALNTQSKAFTSAEGTYQRNLEQAQLVANTQRAGNRSNARNVNTQRALDTNAVSQQNRADQASAVNYQQQLSSLFSERGQLENTQDRMVMGGKHQKNIADQQDKAGFFTNLSKDLTGIGVGMQQAGKVKNEAQYNQDVLDILPQLSKHGIGFKRDKNGKLVIG